MNYSSRITCYISLSTFRFVRNSIDFRGKRFCVVDYFISLRRFVQTLSLIGKNFEEFRQLATDFQISLTFWCVRVESDLVGDQVGSSISVGDDFSVVTSVVRNATEAVGVIMAAIFAGTGQKITDFKFIQQNQVLNYPIIPNHLHRN